MRVINRVHGNTTHLRTNATPAIRASLADLAKIVFFISHFANRGTAIHVDTTDFT
jgi:hypothetical protein